MSRRWTDEQKDFLRSNYGKLTYIEIAEYIGKPVSHVKSQASNFKITCTRKWCDEHLQVLRDLYPNTPTQQIAGLLGYGIMAIYRMANQLGLRKSEAFNNSELSGRMTKENRIRRGLDHRFQKGQPAWNKGKKIGSHPNTAKTQFKKGHLPHNHQPVGTIVVIHGYKKIKLAEPNKWAFLHRQIWVEANGKIPPRHVIAFIDHDSLNCVIENLECVSREDWMKRHTMHNYPEPLKAAIHTLAGMKRRLNSYAEKQDRGSQEHPVRNNGKTHGRR